MAMCSMRGMNNVELFSLVQPMIDAEYFIVVSRSSSFSGFEKVFLPFEHDVWVCLTVTMAIGALTIFILKMASKKVQDFFFGSKVTTPFLCFM
jgi:hypothetical protein